MCENNLSPNFWGKNMWFSLFSVAFGYPDYPTENDKINYKTFFELMGDVLPCSKCRKSYKNHINSGNTKLNYDIFKSRKSLTKWLYLLQNKTNNTSYSNYEYKEIVKKYESNRISCNNNCSSCNNK